MHDPLHARRHHRVVRDHDERCAEVLLQLGEELDHATGVGLIEGTGRFVSQYQRRPVYDGSGHRSPLALTAGKLIGKPVPEVTEPEPREQLLDARCRLCGIGARRAGCAQ